MKISISRFENFGGEHGYILRFFRFSLGVGSQKSLFSRLWISRRFTIWYMWERAALIKKRKQMIEARKKRMEDAAVSEQ